jgi:S-adenosylmethionine synthetase
MLKDYLFTSESVNEGHPDKVCDQISDGILDALLEQDPDSRVACEALIKTGLVVVAGEITSKGKAHFGEIAKEVIRDIGYTTPESGFNCDSCAVVVAVERQSPDISVGVTAGEGLHKEQGAGDQGMMFGYACDETKEYMPFAIYTAHRIGQRLAEVRRSGELPFLLPDGKCQVTVQYRDGKAVSAETVVVSTQHTRDVKHGTLKEAVIEDVVKKVIPSEFITKNTVYHINPTGSFVVGGPQGDCGLTGRTRLALRGAGGLRHRRRGSGVGAGRHLRHRQAARRQDRRAGARALRLEARGADRHPRAEAADLPADGVVRPLRPDARRLVLHVGAYRPREGPALGGRALGEPTTPGAGGGMLRAPTAGRMTGRGSLLAVNGIAAADRPDGVVGATAETCGGLT